MEKLFQAIKRRIALDLALFSRKLLRLLGRRASSFPGSLALRIDPSLLAYFCRGHRQVLVSGTNGKTTTAHFLARILRDAGFQVVHNSSGANMANGLTSAIIAQLSAARDPSSLYVFEIDEAWFAKIASDLDAEYLVLTNLYPDQVDRYGDVAETRKIILEGIHRSPQLRALILCADEPTVASLASETDLPVFYFGREDQARAADRPCHLCFSPQEGGASFQYEGEQAYSTLHNPAVYNIYNAAAALMAGICLKVPLAQAVQSLARQENIAGRMQNLNLGEGREATIVLVKNAVAVDNIFAFMLDSQDATSLLFVLNNHESDGRDISWIKDIDYELLRALLPSLKNIYVSGLCARDLAEELVRQGVSQSMIVVDKELTSAWRTAKAQLQAGEKIYVLPNYTAMLELFSIVESS